ncbi:toxin [Streptomyces aureoverticillatus]|nr:toxin [Streptomyces aureoverticillatus]
MSTGLHWFKSSYSGSQGSECLEVAHSWTKSSHSGDQGGECLEIAPCPATGAAPATIHIRDSKNPAGPILQVTPATWTAFLARLSPLGTRP